MDNSTDKPQAPATNPLPKQPAPMPTDPTKISPSDMLWGNMFIFISTVFFGLNVPAIKWLEPEWLSPIGVAFFRLVGAAVLMWIASLFIKTQRIDRADYGVLAVSGGIGLWAFIFLFCMSLRYASPIDVSIILTFPPVLVVVYRVLRFHEHVGMMEIIGIILAFAGAVLIIAAGGSGDGVPKTNLMGCGLAFASTVCYAAYLVLMEGPSRKYKPVSVMRWVMLGAAVVSLPFIGSVTHSNLIHNPEVTPWLVITFIVVGPTFLAYLLMSPAIKLIGGELVSMYQYLVPVIATVACVLLKMDTLRWDQPVAIVVIIVGMLMINFSKKKSTK